MAKSINLQFFSDATAKCANCKSVYTLGLNVETITLDICANCHPFYTGEETMVDTAGRLEQYQNRLNKITATGGDLGKKAKTKARKTKMSLADLGDDSEEESTEEPTTSDTTPLVATNS